MNDKQSQPPFVRALLRLHQAFWRRRVVQGLVRAAWLSLLIPTIFMAGYLWLDWQVRWYYWLFPMLLVGFLVLLWSMRPLSLRKMVHRLDNRLGLRAQLITAFEMSGPQTASRSIPDSSRSENPVVEQLLQQTVDIIIRMRRQVRTFSFPLWLEMQALIGVAALFSAMLMLDALTPQFPTADPAELPAPWQEPQAEEVLLPDPQLQPPPFAPEIEQTQVVSQEQLQQALQALADALRDQAVTRAIAEAIDRGDLDEAAEGLRRLADQLEELSPEAQDELGEALQEALDNMGGNIPALTEPLQTSRQALGQDNLPQAGQALTDLAEAIDSIEELPQETAQAQPEENGQPGESEQPTQNGEDHASPEAGEPEQSQESGSGSEPEPGEGDSPDQPTEEERLAVEGQPLELESEADLSEQVLEPTELEADSDSEQTPDSPFARQPVNAATDLGPDPLTYPWEKREIIRRYFTPE